MYEMTSPIVRVRRVARARGPCNTRKAEARVAVTANFAGNSDIWIKELPDGPFERFTRDEADQAYPIWTPDGRFVTYVPGGALAFNVLKKRADGTGDTEIILDDPRSLDKADKRGSPPAHVP